MDYNLGFIKQLDFETHVAETLSSYNESLKAINLEKFNSNIIDPIKLLFDKSVYGISFTDVVELEIQRQRDKSNTNAIGYFHQNMFKYIDGCVVPDHGWDVVVELPQKKIYVEMKNKHNTMNSSSSQKTYMRMMAKVLEEPNCYCYLVETIAPKSRNIPWSCCVDGEHHSYDNIRRVSMDQFYKEVTGDDSAFCKMCKQLPITIRKLISQGKVKTQEEDTVIDELSYINLDTLTALYLLAFETYEGFDEL